MSLTRNSEAVSKFTAEISNGVAIRVVDKTGETVISSLDMELVTTPTGAFTSDYFNVEVSTPNKAGYKLYMSTDYQKGSTYTTSLVNTSDSNYEIPTLSQSVSLADFSASGSDYVNQWGYSLDNATYNPAPASTTTDQIKNTMAKVNKELVPVYVGVNANMSKPSGTYENELVFTAVANPVSIDYTLSFDANGGSKISGTLGDLTGTTTAGQYTFTLPDDMPYLSGYGFLGWSEDSSATTADYQPGESYTIIADSQEAQNRTLYAVYGAANFWNIASMQQMTAAICSSVYTPSNATGDDVTLIDNAEDYSSVSGPGTPNVAQRVLYDIRDGETYTVRKLADGNCWMVENLRLSGGTSGRTLYSSDSNISTASWILPAENTSFPTSCVNTAYNMNSGNTTYGNYYNWYAATAGTGTCAMTSGNAPSSICPKGWRLPTGGSSGDFQSLYSQYHSSPAMRADPADIVLSGLRRNNNTEGQSSYGYYWSNMVSGADYAYYLTLTNNGVAPASAYGDKPLGFSVRCVAR